MPGWLNLHFRLIAKGTGPLSFTHDGLKSLEWIVIVYVCWKIPSFNLSMHVLGFLNDTSFRPDHVSNDYIFSANSQWVSPCHDLARDHCSRSWGEWTPWKCHWLSPPPIPTHPNHPHPPIPSPSCISSLSRFMLRISVRLSVWYMRPGWLLLSHLVTTAGSKYYDKEVSLTQNSPSTLRRTAYGVQLTDKLRMRAARTCQRNGSVCGIKFILFYLFYCGIIIDNC